MLEGHKETRIGKMSIIWIVRGMCLKNLTRQISSGLPFPCNYMPKPPHLARVDEEEQQFYSEPLHKDRASHPDILQGELVPAACVRGSKGEGSNIDQLGNHSEKLGLRIYLLLYHNKVYISADSSLPHDSQHPLLGP